MIYLKLAYLLSGLIWVLYLISVRRRLKAALERR